MEEESLDAEVINLLIDEVCGALDKVEEQGKDFNLNELSIALSRIFFIASMRKMTTAQLVAFKDKIGDED